MSTQLDSDAIETNRDRQTQTDDGHRDDDNEFALAADASALLGWLDDSPNFIEMERSYRRPRIGDISYHDRETTVTEMKFLASDYTVDTRACYDTQADVCDAWEEMTYPKHRIETVDGVTGAYLYSWGSTSGGGRRRRRGRRSRQEPAINYEAVQHPDGHGVIQHYATLAAVRTTSGLVLTNEQDYGGGFAVVTQPEGDYDLPLTGVSSVLDGHAESVYDIIRVSREQTRITYTTERDPIGSHRIVTGVTESRDNDRQVTRLDLTTGAAVVLLYDSTATDPDEEKCGFYLDPEEAAAYRGAQGALDALQPIDVLQARERGLEIVPSDEFAGSGAAFGNDDLLGECIVRQGEFYLLPMDDDWVPEGAPIYKPLPVATRETDWEFDHVDTPHKTAVTAFDTVVDDLPKTCPDCDADGLEIAAHTPSAECPACETRVCYDQAEFEEIATDNLIDWATQQFGEQYTEGLEMLDSHTARDLAVVDGSVFVRGTFRHDRNEHKMLNLDDRWHLVAENTRDVTVFDLGADTNSGGVARFE